MNLLVNILKLFSLYGGIHALSNEYAFSCSQGIPFEYGSARLENRADIIADIERVKPTHVFNCAGVTGRPNVDWCESNRVRVDPRK